MSDKILWQPSQEAIANSQMMAFMNFVNGQTGSAFSTYPELHKWSVDNIDLFWGCLFQFLKIKHSQGYDKVIDHKNKMPGAKWFTNCKLNFAENLLWRNDNSEAIVFSSEGERRRSLTFNQLNQQVKGLATFLKEQGLEKGDRVAAFMPNMPQTVVAMLAATSQGACYSSSSPDFGHKGVLDRFGQIEPRVLIAADCYFYKGKRIDLTERINQLVADIPSIEIVVVATMLDDKDLDISNIQKAVRFSDAVETVANDFSFVQVGFDHPVYIMFSSGTTGLPKCMVQGPGVLLNHLKELRLHCDLNEYQSIFYFTTTGWMMWNWLVSSLAVGAKIILYDGNPFYPSEKVLFDLIENEKAQVFGTSAKYITAVQDAGYEPKDDFDFENLRTILSTGSPLSVDGFDFVYQSIKEDVQLASISGGTDLNGCFALGNPILPVRRGELQCLGLGMNVNIFNEKGEAVVNQEGELVCLSPFVSMPLHFFKDTTGEKYQKAYFEKYPGIWRHGDYAILTENGGMIIQGRSDATLNPQGVRIGTAEIYRVVEGMREIADSVVVGQDWQGDSRVVLFVKLEESFLLEDGLIQKIKNTIRDSVSPRHVPAKVIAVDDIPYTKNMKKVEIAVKNIINGRDVTNVEALANPKALALYKDLPELKN